MTLLEKLKYINLDFAKQPLYKMAAELPEKDEDVIPFWQKVVNEEERYIRRFIGKGCRIENLTTALAVAWAEGIEEELRKRFGK